MELAGAGGLRKTALAKSDSPATMLLLYGPDPLFVAAPAFFSAVQKEWGHETERPENTGFQAGIDSVRLSPRMEIYSHAPQAGLPIMELHSHSGPLSSVALLVFSPAQR